MLVWLASHGCTEPRESSASEAPAAKPSAARSPAKGAMSQEAYDAWRQPERVIAALELAGGQTVADIGAGTGYFTLRLARAVGPRGHVTATDIDPRALSALEELAGRAAEEGAGLAPIAVRRVEPADPGLEQGGYDRILLAQVDHLLADPADYLRRLRTALAPGGRVAVANRIYRRAALDRAAPAAGYAIAADVPGLPGQFLVILTPIPEPSHRETPP